MIWMNTGQTDLVTSNAVADVVKRSSIFAYIYYPLSSKGRTSSFGLDDGRSIRSGGM